MSDTLAETIEGRAADSATRDKAPAAPKASGTGKASGSGPGKGSGSSTSTRKGTGRKGGRRSLRQPLTELLTTAGLGLSMVNQFDGALVVSKAEDVARQLDDLAKDNASVHRVLSNLVTASAWGSAVTVLASLAIPIAMNHGAIPANPMLVGAFVPDELVPLLDPPAPREPEPDDVPDGVRPDDVTEDAAA